MKKVALVALLVCAALLAACGAAGPNLNSLAIHSAERTGDQAVKVEVSFDQEYEDVIVSFHSDVNNDTFEGEALYSYTLGKVEPGQMYTVEANDDDEWSFSGTFKQVRVDKDGPQIVAPNMKDEVIKVNVLNGVDNLLETEVAANGGE